MFAARSVAALATYIPFRDLLGLDVVTDGVAAVAGGTGGPLHIVGWVKRRPPVGAIGDKIRPPNVVGDIPLSWFREIVIAALAEITLLPNTAVNQSDLVFCKFGDGVGGKIGNDSAGKFMGIANDIGHGSFAPVFVELLMAFRAGFGADVVSGTYGGKLLLLFLAG